ncbi:MAG: heavy metal-binding domain-containing protein [Sulfurimonas sp.]|nr:heavy metal-binding domain-containing protein [Sulfurimonas sp.]
MSHTCTDSLCEIDAGKYTCPMHPEIMEDKPGTCPKCGMALESISVEAEDDNEELDYMSKRFWVSVVLAVPVFIVAMMSDLAPQFLPDMISMSQVQWFEFILATPVVLWAGYPFFIRGYQSIKTWNLNMFTLIAIGVGAAYIYSIVALLAPEIFPALMQTQEGLISGGFNSPTLGS